MLQFVSHHLRSLRAPEVHIRCIFQRTHRRDRIRVCRLDVAVLGYRNGGVSKNALDRLVRDSKSMQIRRQAAPESVPTMPFQSVLVKSWPNYISCQGVEVYRFPCGALEYQPTAGVS